VTLQLLEEQPGCAAKEACQVQRTVYAGGEVRSWAEVRTYERVLPPAVRKR
jgi:hypothetical protein